MKKIFLLLIRFYQKFLSSFTIYFGIRCRFYPSCSEYAYLCIERFGVLAGGFLALKRFLKCHPLNPGGYDPPPQRSPKFLPKFSKSYQILRKEVTSLWKKDY